MEEIQMAKRWFINAKIKQEIADSCAGGEKTEAQLFYADHFHFASKKEAEKDLEEFLKSFPNKKAVYDFNFFRKEIAE